MRRASSRGGDPLPLSAGQLHAVARAAACELFWVLPKVRWEERRWEVLAERIADPPIREDALDSLGRKRGNVAGAALFATLTRPGNSHLIRILVAFQLIVDFLDNANERHPTEANGLQLHRAVLDALDRDRAPAEYYAQHPWHDDGGYLKALVNECRLASRGLPSWERVSPLLIAEATRAQESFGLNHIADPARRDAALEDWVDRYFPRETRWRWFELGAAASGQLSIFALLALASEPAIGDGEVTAVYDVYWPLVPLITVMLDSFVDQAEDQENGDHLYIGHYADDEEAISRLTELIREAAWRLRELPAGNRHGVIIGCMVAFYLSKESARAPALKSRTEKLLEASGSLARALLPIMRAWRLAYSQGAA